MISSIYKSYFRGTRSVGHRLFIIFLSLLVLGSISFAHSKNINSEVLEANSEDKNLRNALQNGDIAEFRVQLSLGANPTYWFNNTREGWVMCAATKSGREGYLQAIIEAGFDMNFRQGNIASGLSTPLFCAITYRNLNAVKTLVKAGADPRVLYCPTCNRSIASSALWLSSLDMNFELSIWLLKNTSYSTDQLQAIVNMIEILPFPKDSPKNPIRNEFVELLRAEGFSVTPWYDENF